MHFQYNDTSILQPASQYLGFSHIGVDQFENRFVTSHVYRNASFQKKALLNALDSILYIYTEKVNFCLQN